MQYGGDEPSLSLDYSRLVCVLWGVCKQLQTRLDALETATAKKATAKQNSSFIMIVFIIIIIIINHSSRCIFLP